MKDVHINVTYIHLQSNSKNSSPIVPNEILYKTMKISFNNSPTMEFCFFESEIWYA